ncbi:GvpL/GvpF family gas vesicle protein [Streptomyces sp. NPDC002490]|uniref:GvpL/GvpF family gas vesicle protein n=1 Tax=Streptomyces sp. NPDC002490 TaxID=3154416 RepID=UPI003323064F
MTDPRYLYAVCRPWSAPLQAELRGVAGAPAREVRHGSLVAVVSAVPARAFAGESLRAHLADPQWYAGIVRAHEAVLSALATVTTPLPVRPGAVFPDDSAVRVLLAADGDRLARTLDRLAGRVEWTVTVTGEPGAADDGPPPGGAPEGAVREVHERLTALADEWRLDPPDRHGAPPPSQGPVLLRAAYLVPRTLSEEFVETVDRYGAGRPAPTASLSGPWAPRSFTPAPYGGD